METLLLVGAPIAEQTRTATLMERHGFDVLTAASAEDAVSQCHERRPDLVLAPAGLMRTDGEHLTTALRGDTHTRHVGLLCLADSIEEAEAEMRRGAADTVLLRPVRTRTLARELGLIVDQRQERTKRASRRS